ISAMRPAYAVRPFFYVFRHAEATLQDRPARARHRSPPRRPLARDVRRDGLEPRRRGRVPAGRVRQGLLRRAHRGRAGLAVPRARVPHSGAETGQLAVALVVRSEEHTSELQSLAYLVCRLLLEKKK